MTARILIVDEAAANTRLLQARLEAEYYEVAVARDGEAALRLARNWQPDLILLDVLLPGADGYGFCCRLKADAATHHIPIVMLSSQDRPEERLRGLECGADDFLPRPLQYDTLLARLRSLVRLKRMLDEWRARGETARALGLAGNLPGAPADEPSIAGARVMVVDDTDATARVVQEALLREGIVPDRARGEAEALALGGAVPLDLIVLSLSILGADPLRLASKLRAADATHDVPMLLVAEPFQRARLLRGFDLGANDWVQRPVDENELRMRARNQIRRKFYQDRLRADLGQALEMALTDPLTGLYNRRYLMRHLRNLLTAAPARSVAVLMMDVDHFKELNDRFGHAAGDGALQQIARTLRGRTRVFDSLARYGGEEFVLVMPSTGLHDAAATAERLRLAIESLPFRLERGEPYRLTISIGVALSGGRESSAEKLVEQADMALYAAKRAGRNRVEIAPAE